MPQKDKKIKETPELEIKPAEPIQEEAPEISLRNPEMHEEATEDMVEFTSLSGEGAPPADAPVDTPDTPPTEEPIVVEKVSSPIKVDDPMVACHILKSHTCSVGPVNYDLKKGESAKLPNSVATILAHAGVLIKK